MENKILFMNSKRIYILSTGRTGTNFLAQVLNDIIDDFNIGHQQIGSRSINIFAKLPLKNNIYLYFLYKLFDFFNRGVPPNSTIDPLLSVALYKLIKFKKIKIDIKIIHLVRSPEDFVTSFLNWKDQSWKRKIILHFLLPFWNPVPLFHGVSFKRWVLMSKFEKFCWIWTFKNTMFDDLQYLQKENYYFIKIEDLIQSQSKEDHLKSLLEFCGIKPPKKIKLNTDIKVNRSKGNKFPKYKDWSNKHRFLLSEYCQYLKLKYGYREL